MVSKQKILICDDDSNIAELISLYLNKECFETLIVNDGESVLPAMETFAPNLILLDIMLPGMDGFEVQERIKEKNIPIIFLTAMQDVTDKVRGLRSGAEDYIVKPFEVMELLARVEVVLRRCHKAVGRLVYETIEIDPERHIVTKDGEPVFVSPREFEVLCYFIKHQDIVLSRERLLADLWDINYQGESRTVDTHVQQVRRKLGLKDKLLTIPKYGYKLVRG